MKKDQLKRTRIKTVDKLLSAYYDLPCEKSRNQGLLVDNIVQLRNWLYIDKTKKVDIMTLRTEFVFKKGEQIGVVYIKTRHEKPHLPKSHCRQCHYTWVLRNTTPPQKCNNVRGYTDDNEVKHSPCSHPRSWDQWPENFNVDTCGCNTCKKIYYEELEEQAEAARNDFKVVNG